MRYNNKFFKTEEEAKAFQKKHGGALYKNTWGSRTKREFSVECAVAYDARGESINRVKTPYCVAWNERD